MAANMAMSALNDESSSSSSSSSSNAEEEEEKEEIEQRESLAEQVETLRETIRANPNDYASRVAIIKALRSQDIWRQWTADEEKLVYGDDDSISVEGVRKLVELYERAVVDFLSPDLWLDFCNFLTTIHLSSLAEDDADKMQTEGEGDAKEEPLVTETEVRERFEEALALLAFHIPSSHRLWQAFRKFEESLADVAASKGNQEALKAQLERIRKLYSRQLHLPSLNMDEVYEEYVNWEIKLGEGEDFEPTFHETFEKALEQLADRADHEVNVHLAEGMKIDPTQPDYAKLEHWRAYIKFEEEILHNKKGNPIRVRCLYERCLQQFSLSFDIWESYSFFMMDNYKKALDSVIEVQLRAVRNYSYSYVLWCHLILTMDRAEKSKEDINAIFEKALSSGLQSAHDFLQVYKYFSDHRVRRVTDWADASQTDLIFKLFDSNVEYFRKYFPDDSSDLERYYATIAERKLKDKKVAMERWESLVSKGGRFASNWLEAVNFALRVDDLPKARNFLKRAQGVHTDQPELIWKAWVDFERIEGTFDEFGLALERCTKAQRAQEAQYYAQQLLQQVSSTLGDQSAESSTAFTSTPKTQPKTAKGRGKKRSYDEMDASDSQESTKKRRKLEESKESKKPPRQSTVDRPPAGKSFDPLAIHVSGIPSHYMTSTDETTIKSTLKALFEPFGEVKEVRTVTSFEGTLKPAVYVEFTQEVSCQNALNSQSSPILVIPSPVDGSIATASSNSHSLVVRPAIAFKGEIKPHSHVPLQPRDPSTSHKPRALGQPRQAHSEQFTIYVSNLSPRTTEESLEKFFTGVDKCAAPVSIRLIKDHATGKSRGFAYIQFTSDEEVTKVVKAKNDKLLEGRLIRAAPSNPSRGSLLPKSSAAATATATATAAAATTPTPSASHEAAKDADHSSSAMPPTTTAPAKFAKPTMVPRAVQKKRLAITTTTTTTTTTTSSSSTSSTTKPSEAPINTKSE